MTFILPTDAGYLRAKSIKQGTAHPDPSYHRFLEQFHVRYGISPLTISFDFIDGQRGQGKTRRLTVVLERTAQYQTFLAGAFNYDKTKQKEIAQLVTETVEARNLRAKSDVPQRRPPSAPPPEGIFVCFEDFESVAKWEVHNLATAAELDDFTASLGIAEQFWCIQRLAGPPIVFVHTDQQAQALRVSAAPTKWADAYFEIAKQHDEFGYLERSEITIAVDSKENFEANFSSNWYYYFK